MNARLRKDVLRVTLLLAVSMLIRSISVADDGRKPSSVSDYESRLSAEKRTIELITGVDGGSELTVQASGDGVMKIHTTFGLSNRRIERIFYFDQKKLKIASESSASYKWDEKKEAFDYTKLEDAKTCTVHFLKDEKLDIQGDRTVFDLETVKESIKSLQAQAELFMKAAESGKDTVDLEKELKGR